MNKKAQSALEYLMTYGWALIVIAIVIGILWYVTSSATGGVTCQSRSNNFTVTAQAVSAGENGVKMTLRNGTGQSVYFGRADTNAAGSVFTGSYIVEPHIEIPANGTFNISTGINAPESGQSFDKGIVTIYVNIGTLPASFDVICTGKV